jgi:hypothetical protein
MNTQKINQIISCNLFEQVITVIDEILFVNLDYLTNRQYQSTGLNELLYEIGGYKNHVVVFLIRDGVNCRFTGLREVIIHVIEALQLTKDTCFHYGYDNLNLENSTFIELNVLQMWGHLCYEKIQNLPLSSNTFHKKFAGLYARHDIYRLKIFRYLHTNYYDHSILAFNSVNGVYSNRFEQMFNDDVKWYSQHCPKFLDFPSANNWVSYTNSLDRIGEHYNNYFIEIVAETDFYSNVFFTEKTMKNLYLGKPFILWSGVNSLATLRKAGFRTFSPYIDESYDTILNVRDRLEAIFREIDRLANLSYRELADLNSKMNEIFQHNRNCFTKKLLTD